MSVSSLTGLLVGYTLVTLLAVASLAIAMSRRLTRDLAARLIIGAAVALIPVVLAVGVSIGNRLDGPDRETPEETRSHQVAIAVPSPTPNPTPTEPPDVAQATETSSTDIALNQVPEGAPQGGSGADALAILNEKLTEPAIRAVFERTDYLVVTGEVDRAWVWGPTAITGPIEEPYSGAEGNVRIVQYFDGGRIELKAAEQRVDEGWPVTTGLLVNEMVSGQIQVGAEEYENRGPAEIPILGATLTPNGPTYAMLGALRDDSAGRIGATIDQLLDVDGDLLTIESLADLRITIASFDRTSRHGIAEPFWEYMTSSGPIWVDGERREGRLFADPYFATGHPITEPFWVSIGEDGATRAILMQCFERRCLTYAPDSSARWSVSSNNAGRHYYSWRYDVDLD